MKSFFQPYSGALFTSLLALLYSLQAGAQTRTDPWLQALLATHASPLLQKILDQPDTFRYQVIYTRIDRDSLNRPHFTNYYLREDARSYFNPASMVKLPVACMALEKLRELSKYGVDRNTPMFTDSSYSGQSRVTADSSSPDGLPSLGQYIRKVFLVSDNNAYNRLYEWVGQQRMNEELWKMGYTDARITRRFVPMTLEENRHTNAIRLQKGARILYRQPPAFDTLSFDFSRRILLGGAHYDRNDSLVQGPMDFTTQNCIPLKDLQQILQSVLFPSSVPERQRFRLSREDERFLYQYMSEYPRESASPRYDSSEFPDTYAKFYFRGKENSIPSYIRVFNKTGWSYGFLTDVSYIVDFQHRVEYMLSAVIYTNSDGVLNDDRYDYAEYGYPFFHEINRIIYQYELNRTRSVLPDLSAFRFTYH